MEEKQCLSWGCWNFVAPLIPVTDDLTMEIYVMTFNALKKAEEHRKEKNA